MEVKFTEAAQQDIIDSYLYGLVNFGQSQADKYECKIKEVIGIIAENPQIARKRTDFYPPVHIFHSGKHYIVYSFENNCVLIQRVLRDEVDLFRHL